MSEPQREGCDACPRSGLTEAELEVMGHLGEAWNAFLALPVQHPDDMRDFVDALHRQQDLIAARIARRAHPHFWPSIEE